MAHLRALAVRPAWLTLIALAACGDGGNASRAPDDQQDAEVSMDGGDEQDAGDDDADLSDAGAEDDATVDGGDGDATAPDVDAGAGDISECEGDLLEFSAARSVGRPLAAGISANRVHLVYVVPSGGGTSGKNNAQGLHYVPFDTTGEVGDGVDVVNVGVDTYNRTRDPALVVSASKVELFYTSNSAGAFDLFYKDLAAGTAPSRETSGNTRNEFALTAGSFGDSAAVVYSNESELVGVPGALTLKLPGQPASELVAEAAGYHAGQVAFSELGSSGERRGVAAFVSDLAAKPGLFALPVGANGGPGGALVTLSTLAGGSSAIDVARGRDGRGGLVYTEAAAGGAHQLRFRTVAEDGTIGTSVRNLTASNQNLRDISIAPYSHGYVIAYRRLGGPPNAAASIYLLFVDAEGNRSGTRLVRAASLSGGGLKVLVANDGRLVVLWADTETVTDETTKQTVTALKVRAARLNCAP